MDSAGPGSRRLVTLVAEELAAVGSGKQGGAALDRLTRRIAHEVGDTCNVYLLDGEHLSLISGAHRDPEGERLLRAHGTVRLAESAVMARVVKTGQRVEMKQTAAKHLRSFMSDEMGPYLDRFGMSAMLLAPLRADGRVIGVVGLARVAHADPFDADSGTQLQELADRLAPALLSGGAEPGAARHRARGAARTRPELGTDLGSLMRRRGPASA